MNKNRDIEIYKLRKKFYESSSKNNHLDITDNIHFEKLTVNKKIELMEQIQEFIEHIERTEKTLVNS